MKNFIYVILLIILLSIAAVLYFAAQTPEKTPTEGASQTLVGTVSAIDQSQIMLDGPSLITIADARGQSHIIAVPSMGLPTCVAATQIADPFTVAVGDTVRVTGSVDSAGHIVPCDVADHELRVTSTMRDAAYGYEFSYDKGAYVTLEDTGSTHPNFVTGLTLINKQEYELLQNTIDAREGPPTINLRIYTNPKNLHAPVWAMQNPRETNYNLMIGTTKESFVGGANAVRYLVDGLYPMETYVIANGDHIYVLSGSYLSQDDQIYADFQSLVASFTFIPNDAVRLPGTIQPNKPKTTPVTPDQSAVVCTDEQKAAQACTMEYAPVCGLVQVQCITTPCDPIPETFSNGCTACARGNVISYTPGECAS